MGFTAVEKLGENGWPNGSGNGHGPFLDSVSPVMKSMEQALRDIASSGVPVLLIGEPGSGKKAVGRRIHELSGRPAFTILSCASLSPEFGRSNGHAGNGRAGSGSDGSLPEGTVFLDEVSELSPACQVRLLELLPEEEQAATASAPGWRLISATRRDLEKEVRAGRFREDLSYRLSGIGLRLPPLRQRKEDIPALAEFFLEKYTQRLACSKPQLSASGMRLLLDHSWPGNLRELEDAMKKIVALGTEEAILADLRHGNGRARNGNGNGESLSLKEAARAASRLAERELILKVLTRTHWNRKRAAQELQISYKALLYKLKQIRLDSAGS
ncbi:MAG: sigma 54-interacting transcriptional regulator [Terriglobales bacterium]